MLTLTPPESQKNMPDASVILSPLPRFMALCLTALLVSQSLPAEQRLQQPNPSQSQQSVQSLESQMPPPQQQTIVGPPPLPSDAPLSGSQSQPLSSEATSASKDALPSAPVPQAASQSQQQPPQSPAPPQEPLGTAAAPTEKPTGVAGSRPAGAAIAPAKQRRVRAIVISVALVLAAGVAIGATAGLSRASHSAPQ